MFRLLRRLGEAKTLFSLLFGPLSQALQNGKKRKALKNIGLNIWQTLSLLNKIRP